MTAPRGRTQKLCIFCGGPNVSKEHFYSSWMAALLPNVTRAGHASRMATRDVIAGEIVGRKTNKPVPLTTMKFRAPCASCNSSWMNQIEAAARPLLTEMILGRDIVLDAPDQLAIARWIALKIMVSEHAYQDATVTPAEERMRLKDRGTIPDWFRIYIGKHSAREDAGHFSASSVTSLATGPAPPMHGMAKNVQQGSFLAGRLFVHVNASRAPGFHIEDRVKAPHVYEEMRIWPLARSKFSWPAGPVLTAEQIADLFSSWDQVLRARTNMTWEGGHPELRGG